MKTREFIEANCNFLIIEGWVNKDGGSFVLENGERWTLTSAELQALPLPFPLWKNIGVVHDSSFELAKLALIEFDLKRALDNQRLAEMSNDMYFTSAQKRRDDEHIQKLRERLKNEVDKTKARPK